MPEFEKGKYIVFFTRKNWFSPQVAREGKVLEVVKGRGLWVQCYDGTGRWFVTIKNL